MLAVFKKEFNSSLRSMTGPIFISAVLLIMGFFSMIYVFMGGTTNFEYAVVSGSFLSLLLTPILTMRSFSEERKSKTDQLLYSLPISTTQVVLGKYFAMVCVFAIPCAVICLYPLIASFYANGGMNFAICYGAILAYFLLGCALIALCMLISSFFESQVICSIVSIVTILLLYMVMSVEAMIPQSPIFTVLVLVVLSIAVGYVIGSSTKSLIAGTACGTALTIAAFVVYFVNENLYSGLGSKIISAIFIFQPINAFANNTFDIPCLVYYLSAACLFVFCTVQSFERRRWN